MKSVKNTFVDFFWKFEDIVAPSGVFDLGIIQIFAPRVKIFRNLDVFKVDDQQLIRYLYMEKNFDTESLLKLVQDSTQRLKVVLTVLVLGISFYHFAKRDFAYRETTFFDDFMIDSFGPVQRAFTDSQNWLSDIVNHYVANVNASKNNETLQKRIVKLESDLLSTSETTKENERLKELLKFGQNLKHQEVLAQIVAWDASSDFRVIRINKGAADGVKIQSAVVTSDGVVGYIYRLTDHFADVLTILDPNNRVDGLVARIRAHGIVEGYTDRLALMKYVTRTEPVILDDTILTSGLGNIYPKGLVIGNVAKIERQSYGITQHIEISPAVDFSRLEEVIVLVSSADDSKKLEWNALDAFDGSDN